MKEDLRKIIIAVILFIIALVVPFANEWINKAIFIVSYLIVGLEVIKEALEHLFKGKLFD